MLTLELFGTGNGLLTKWVRIPANSSGLFKPLETPLKVKSQTSCAFKAVNRIIASDNWDGSQPHVNANGFEYDNVDKTCAVGSALFEDFAGEVTQGRLEKPNRKQVFVETSCLTNGRNSWFI